MASAPALQQSYQSGYQAGYEAGITGGVNALPFNSQDQNGDDLMTGDAHPDGNLFYANYSFLY